MLIIPALGRKRGEVSEFKVSLSCVLRPCFKREKKKFGKEGKRSICSCSLIQQLLMFGFFFSNFIWINHLT